MAKTFYLNPEPLANPLHPSATHQQELAEAVTTPSTISVTGIGYGGKILYTGITTAGALNNQSFAAGTYETQLDILAISNNMSCGVLNQSGAVGHFGRVNAALTVEVEVHQQTQPAFTTPGLKIASYTGSWTNPGSNTDRFELVVAGARISGGMMGSDQISFEIGELDDYVTGPWSPVYTGDTVFENVEHAFEITFEGAELV